MDYRQQMHETARELAQQAHTAMMRNSRTAVYLYHKPSEIDGEGEVALVIGDVQAPKGFVPSMPESLSITWTLEQTKYSIYGTMTILPILPLKGN